MTPTEQKELMNKVIEDLRPEAREYVKSIMGDKFKTTKDNYGKVMGFLSSLSEKAGTKTAAILFLAAMVREGYPKDTASQLGNIMGWYS
jgi:hypothetical protein